MAECERLGSRHGWHSLCANRSPRRGAAAPAAARSLAARTIPRGNLVGENGYEVTLVRRQDTQTRTFTHRQPVRVKFSVWHASRSTRSPPVALFGRSWMTTA
jgi:hypothetical protein